jgi:O-succinylbenzoic acid--CoA ligase
VQTNMTPETTLPNWLARCATNTPERLAVKQSAGAMQWSFAELHQQSQRLARQLASLGIQVGARGAAESADTAEGGGARVALLAANTAATVACIHALPLLGAVLVPLNTRLTLDELCWQVRDARADLLVSDERFAETAASIAEAFPKVRSATLLLDQEQRAASLSGLTEADVPLRETICLSDTQAIMYTSGTSGQPKGAIITFGMQWWNAIGSALNLGHDPQDCWLACMPLFHIGGLSILMRSVIYGISVILHEKFDPLAVNQAIVEDRVTIISVVALMLQRMLDALNEGTSALEAQAARYPAHLRCVLLGGGPAPRSLLEDCARRQIPVVQTYGLTESCSQAVTLSPADALRKLGSAGRPLLPVQLRITHDGLPVPAGKPGEIQLRGPTITPGYVDRPDAMARAFQGGWFATGDIGLLDTDGYLYVLDRRDDLIISGGENIYPAEIESVLQAHPAVAEAGVCGQPDPQWGQVPVAFVHLREESSTRVDDLLAFAAQRLARYKIPRHLYITGQLPRNASGKLLRRELAQMLHDERRVTDRH